MTSIILVRHGQTEWNRVEKFRGRADLPLNPTGLHQATLTAQTISARWHPLAVFCSPLQRALQTAQQIAQPLKLEAQAVAELIDIDYGKWQGLTYEEASQNWPQEIENWLNHPALVRIPDGESLQQVRMRVMAALLDLCARYPTGEIVVVGHTVINRLIILDVLGLENDHFWYIRQHPCAINVIEKDNQKFALELMNDTCHLGQILYLPLSSTK